MSEIFPEQDQPPECTEAQRVMGNWRERESQTRRGYVKNSDRKQCCPGENNKERKPFEDLLEFIIKAFTIT